MDNKYPSNSHKARAAASKQQPKEERKLEKVVSGAVSTRKKSSASKLTDLFIAEDAKNVKSYVILDVLVPAIKDAVYNIICDSAGMIFGKPIRGRGSSTISTRDNYTKYWDGRDRSYQPARPRTAFDYEDLTFESRIDAETVLNELRLEIHNYGLVSVANAYDLSGKTAPHTYHNYGWTSLERAEVMRVRDGWIIQFPKPLPLD